MLIAIKTPTFSFLFNVRSRRNVHGSTAKIKSHAADWAPVPIQILVPTPDAQQAPSRSGCHIFWMGMHWIQGMAALNAMEMFRVMIRNQTNFLVFPVVRRSRVTAKAVLEKLIALRVVVARLLRMSENRGPSRIMRS